MTTSESSSSTPSPQVSSTTLIPPVSDLPSTPRSPSVLVDPEHSHISSCTWLGLKETPVTPLPYIVDEPAEGREV